MPFTAYFKQFPRIIPTNKSPSANLPVYHVNPFFFISELDLTSSPPLRDGRFMKLSRDICKINYKAPDKVCYIFKNNFKYILNIYFLFRIGDTFMYFILTFQVRVVRILMQCILYTYSFKNY